jgi:hypothetical protein
MPHFKKWAEEFAHIDFSRKSTKQADMKVHPSTFNHEFLAELGDKAFSRRSFRKWERITCSHGATLQEVFILRHGEFPRVVDCVLYPDSNEQVEVSFIP